MWDLNKSQAKELTTKYLTKYLEDKQFVLKKTKSANIQYIRQTKTGFDALYLSFLDSFPGQKIDYLLVKRVDVVEKIVDEILAVIDSKRIIDKKSTTFATNYGMINNLRNNTYMPEMMNELDVENSCNQLNYFLENTGFGYLDKFEDITKFDNEINGNVFWTTDWSTPFDLRNHFDIKRVIIAYLAKNPKFNEVVDKTYEIMSQNSDGTFYNYDRNNLTLRIPYTVHYLKNCFPCLV